jgi:hypothetical protein
MNRFINKLHNFCLQSAKVIILILSVLLFFTAFFTSSYAYMDTQKMIYTLDNVVFSALSILTILVVIYLLIDLSQTSKYIKYFLLTLVLLLYGVGGIFLIIFNKSAPGADPMSVFRIAEEFANGYFGAIHPTDSYLSYYPHQIGLVAYYEILLRFWNLISNDVIGYHFIKVINIAWTLILILCFYKIIKLLFIDDKFQISYLILLILNLPLLMFSTFVYGEIPSIAIFSLGLLLLIKILNEDYANKRSKYLFIFLSILCFALCVSIRQNTLVSMLAVFIVLFFVALRKRKYNLLFLDAIYIIVCFTALPSIQYFYELRAGNYLNDGVPPLTFIAMGMQYAYRGNGWYNGYNILTYQNTNLDSVLANQVAWGYIKERLHYFSQNIDECLKFYFNKFQVQWCDGTYASLQATLATLGGRNHFFENLYAYSGFSHIIFIFLCNVFQNLLYLGNCIFSIISFKDKEKKFGFPYFLCLIAVIGIFLFHTLWEANSRYIFQSNLLLLPTAAYGLGYLISLNRKK